MKRRMVEHFEKNSLLPVLTNTPHVTDRGAQVLLELDRDVRDTRGRADVAWFRLVLEDTNIGDGGLEALSRAFLNTTTPHPRLTVRRVQDLDDETAVLLADALDQDPSWETVWIQEDCNPYYCDFQSLGVKALISALSNNHVWQMVVLNCTNLGEKGVDALAEAL